ncbi:uncharacterized protein LOC108338275 [Vigna angularis]|uniref:uncharacterized protein LOC108338275 n=1 Tax=Phaseolus angularis TaxID=3914 RepID=UPI0022B4C415|nr:uncharacterized protein LOC108338275 [Vigna angularis]
MEGKLHALENRMEGKMNVVEGRMEHLEMTVDGLKAESAANRQDLIAMRKDIQELLRLMGVRSKPNGESSDGSNGSVNDNGGGRRDGAEGEREGERSENPPNWRRRVELPAFEGADPLNWITRAEKFFEIQKVAEAEKIELAHISMEGSAGYWFKFWKEKASDRTWEGLKEALLIRFESRYRGGIFERMAAIKQTATVEEYVKEFEALAGQTKAFSDDQLLGYFLAGLREELRCQVRPHDPRNLMTAMKLARDVEEALRGLGLMGWTPSRNPPSWGRTTGGGTGVVRTDPPKSQTMRTTPTESVGSVRRDITTGGGLVRGGMHGGSDGRGRSSRNLPYPEFLKRREEGRCFRCGGPFSPGHQCPEKSLRAVILAEDEEEDVEGEDVEPEPPGMELSAFSAGGLTQPKTLKLQGKVGGKDVLILIDSGVSHNFVSRRLVEELQLAQEDTPPYQVSLGDGRKKRTSGCCPKVVVDMGGVAIGEKFYLFDLGGVDMILGVEWLAKLGEITLNWRESTMAFDHAGKRVVVKGDPKLDKRVVEPEKLMKLSEVEVWAFVWSLEGERTSAKEVEGEEWAEEPNGDLEDILTRHAGVFQEPTGLPPNKKEKHRITLKEGTDPVNVRPYRYPHVMKEEIERQVTDMLHAGIIRPSVSPYSSPVILVKKKDGSWRFCIDYRALNRATVPNKFPIPVIEELLDELQGAQYFSKVDLKAGYHQIRMNKEDVQKTAFRTHLGHYEFLVMPFGLTNAPSTFQSAMNDLLGPFLRRFALVFFDDILIYSATWGEHLRHVEQVLSYLQQNHWVAN